MAGRGRVGGGTNLRSTLQMSVKFGHFVELYVVSFEQKFFELGNFTGFKAFLPAGRTHKLKKTVEKDLLEITILPN